MVSLCVALLAACTEEGASDLSIAVADEAADPVVLEIPIAYIERPLPETAPDLRDPLAFNPGARLLLRQSATASAAEVDITQRIIAVYLAAEALADSEVAIDIKDLESSFDGTRLIFSARLVPEPVSANLDETSWDIWVVDIETLQPEYLIPSRLKRNEGIETGGGQDLAPHYLSDDRVVFSSTRHVASQSRLLNEGRTQIFSPLAESGPDPAAVLHIYDPQQRDEEFTQISFNLSHDLDPVLLDSGIIAFSRWNNTLGSHFSIFNIHPNGFDLSPGYGYHSLDTGSNGDQIEFTQPRENANGDLLSLVRGFAPASLGGDITVINTAEFVDNGQPDWQNLGSPNSAQQPLHQQQVTTDESLSPGGNYTSVYPLRDGTGRSLVSWSQCRVTTQDRGIQPCSLESDTATAAPARYGIWLYDPDDDTQRPVLQPADGAWISEVIAAEPRDYPGIAAPSRAYDAALAQAGFGQLLIDSVYDFDGNTDASATISSRALPGSTAFTQRPARFLRFIYPVPIPNNDVLRIPRYAAGVAGSRNFREIAGYIPVEPDGSATAQVQANRPFSFELVDATGKRTGARHRYWLQLAAGEVMHCTGCHERTGGLPHGLATSQPPPANVGAVALSGGDLGFPGTDSSRLYAGEPGQTMAQILDYQMVSSSGGNGRELELHPRYQDQWSDPLLPADPPIDNLDYSGDWTDLDPARPLIVDNLDPTLPARIVINYIDHIQPIWERSRTAVADSSGTLIDSCIGCHNSTADTLPPPGQLDLGQQPSDIDPDHVRSYRELLSNDNQQWLDSGGNLADRQRVCNELDEEGNLLTFTDPVSIGRPMQAGTARGSTRFFNCFEGANCGAPAAPALPDNCLEDGGTPVPATFNTVDHSSLLQPAELRLIAEWLDLGGQYYNNPFDSRLQ